MSLGRRIRQARRSTGLSMARLAAEIGVDPKSIQRWEGGSTTPSVEHLRDLSRRLGCSYEWLIDGRRRTG